MNKFYFFEVYVFKLRFYNKNMFLIIEEVVKSLVKYFFFLREII